MGQQEEELQFGQLMSETCLGGYQEIREMLIERLSPKGTKVSPFYLTVGFLVWHFR